MQIGEERDYNEGQGLALAVVSILALCVVLGFAFS
jgi:hypothetical protein